jgi:multidrug resistance efflux pump
MNASLEIAKQAIHDKLESQVKTAEAKLDAVKARVEAAKADLEIKAIAALLPKKQAIQQKLEELKNLSADRWKQAKADLERRIAEFEKSVKTLESKAKELATKAS